MGRLGGRHGGGGRLAGAREGRGWMRQGKEVWGGRFGVADEASGGMGAGGPGTKNGAGALRASAHTSLHLACPSLVPRSGLCP